MSNYNTRNASRQGGHEINYISAIPQGDNVVDVVKTSFEPSCHIKRITKELYLKGTYDKEGNFITDGEIHEVAGKESPMRNRRSLKRIFKELRQLITHNYKGGTSELFVTLTYAQQTNDHKQVHNDFKNFWKRLKRTVPEVDLSYISIVEPHETGMFHIHLLLRANNFEYLFIPNELMAETWGLGFTQTERLEDVDNVGAYFIAYFSNLEITDPDQIAKYEKAGDLEEKNGKKYIKGKRIDFYPDGMQIHRHSRDIAKPEKLTGQAAAGLASSLGQPSFAQTKTIESTDILGRPKEAYVTTEQYKRK